MNRNEAIRKLARYLNSQFKSAKVGDKEADHLLKFLEKEVGMELPRPTKTEAK